MNISLPIRELLLRNQKAVIPGFGAFIIKHRPAELNRTTRVLTPPSKIISFDNRQQSDDEQLSRYLAQKLKKSRAEANGIIEKFVLSAEAKLNAKEAFLLEGLGSLTRDHAGDFTFKPDEEAVKLANLFELPKLDVISAPAASTVPVVERPAEQASFSYKRKRRWWIPAALLALIVGLATVAYYTGFYESFVANLKTDTVFAESGENSGNLVFGNRGVSDSSQAGADTLREKISRELDERTSRENALQYQEVESKPATEKANKMPVQDTPLSIRSDKAYHIISGAFLVPNNAERQKVQLEKKGCSPYLLPKRGDYFMVSLGSYDTNDQAVEAMRQLKIRLKQELWILKR